jgi:hypothetical protein
VQKSNIRISKRLKFHTPNTVDEIEATWLYPFLLGMQDVNEARIRCHAASFAQSKGHEPG